jgi:hypothetical protein
MLQQKYVNQESAIASYNYTDIAEGTGMVGFNCCYATNSFLSTEELYSVNIETTNSTGEADYTKIIDIDFNLSAFNMPKTIGGTGICMVCFAFAETTPGTKNIKIIARVRKWDGTTETEIANGEEVYTNAPDGIYLAPILITIPETDFKKGEILRFTIEGWGQDTSDGCVVRLTIAHDPKNRDGTYIVPSTDSPETTTTLKFYCPFSLDL